MNKNKIKKILEETKGTTIVAATKYVGIETIKKLVELGIRDIGENRVEALENKYDPSLDVRWHFIGHLQRNKAKRVANLIDVLHSLDSIELAQLLNKLRNKPLDVFVEIKLTESDTKSGIKKEELEDFLNSLKSLENIHVVGLMTMTDPESSDEDKSRVFNELYLLKEKHHLKYLSMGMSDDYQIAIKNHTTHIRLGRILYEKSDVMKEFIHYFN